MSVSLAPRVMPGGRAAPAQPPLMDVLGADWRMDAASVGVAWDDDLACFALADGSLAMGRAEWDGAPVVGPRDGGGVELSPGSAPPPPMIRARVHRGACLSVARDAGGGFLSGGEDGVFAQVGADGTVRTLRTFDAWVDHVAAAGRLRACASGNAVHVQGSCAATIELPGIATALAFDHGGRHLAAAHYRGVTVWAAATGALRRLDVPGHPRALAWSFDGRFLVCGMQDNAVYGLRLDTGEGFPIGATHAQPRSLSFAASGAFVASSGGARALCWAYDPPAEDADGCGAPSSRTPVNRVACHPTRAMLAAGYHNGAVILCQPGTDDQVFARGSAAGKPGAAPGVVPPGSSVTALGWSDNGARLAIGTEGGTLGLLALPPGLFRFGPVPARRTP